MAIDTSTKNEFQQNPEINPRPGFEEMRIQVPYPCKAKCVWCSTWKKNPRFQELYEGGASDEIMNFYARVVKDEKPRRLMLSGGEPLLYPGINKFLERVAPHVEEIFLYTSFQYDPEDLSHLNLKKLPAEKMTFTHSVIDFLPEKWAKGTQNFPHELYVANLRAAQDWPARKMIKFVLNHEHLSQEVDLFRELVQPDDSYILEAKLLNNQSNNYGKKQIAKTRDIVFKNRELVGISTNNELQLENIMSGRVIENCIHWKLPELRFALYRENPGDIVLKYRFCGYFSPDWGYKIHINNYKNGMFYRAFTKGRFKEACGDCRLLHYNNPLEEGSVAEE